MKDKQYFIPFIDILLSDSSRNHQTKGKVGIFDQHVCVVRGTGREPLQTHIIRLYHLILFHPFDDS